MPTYRGGLVPGISDKIGGVMDSLPVRALEAVGEAASDIWNGLAYTWDSVPTPTQPREPIFQRPPGQPKGVIFGHPLGLHKEEEQEYKVAFGERHYGPIGERWG